MIKTFLLFLAAFALVAGGVVLLSGCESADRAAAERAQAEASLEVARGQAYAERVRADAAAAAERAAMREAQRDAAHERALEVLPYVLLVAGAVVVALVVVLMYWDLRHLRETGTDVRLLAHLQRLELELDERDRALLRAVAQLDRRSLPEERRREVVVYPERRR